MKGDFSQSFWLIAAIILGLAALALIFYLGSQNLLSFEKLKDIDLGAGNLFGGGK